MSALVASARRERRLTEWRDYVAQNVWAIGKTQLADPDKYPWPSWIEFTAEPDEIQPEQSGEDIKNELLQRWGGGG